ncbi:MAG: hypothetical protein QOH12_3026 [Solirubrobacteraceae bacterium]|jgi:hypothetical protein|nr:hypothetical protein [Solirubrobacteraceae bacterium]
MFEPTSDARYRGQFRPEFSRLHRDGDLFWVVPFPVRYVVGITGERLAGKSATLAYLSEKRGFRLYSLATELRAIALRRGIPLEPRSVLQDLGDEVRAENDDKAFLARLTLRRIHRDHHNHPPGEPANRVAVGGFKRPEEIALFQNLARFSQFDVRTDRRVRFTRAKSSGILELELSHVTPRPPLTEATFRRHIDERDLRGRDNEWTGAYGQLVGKVIDYPGAVTIFNNGTLAELYTTLDGKVRERDEEFRSAST